MKIKDLILDKLEIPVDQFCKQIKVSRPVVAGIINGTYTHNLSLLTIKKICKYFNEDYRNYI